MKSKNLFFALHFTRLFVSLRQISRRKMKLNIEERVLHFKQPAGTSRGVYTTRRIWLITAMDEEGRVTGIGECAPLPQLSCDDIPDYAEVLRAFCDEVERTGVIPYEALRPYPSMLFGLESIKPTSNPSRATGVFRAATDVAAAPPRGANTPFATEGWLGVGFVSPSTVLFGWGRSRRCTNGLRRSWRRDSTA